MIIQGTIIRLIILASLMVFMVIPVQSQDDKGTKIGGLQNDRAAGVIIDNEGNIVISGTSRSYGNGGDDFILIKMDPEGNVIYQQVYQWEHHERAHGLELTMDGKYMIVGEVWDWGYGREDIFLLKIDNNGDKLWENYYGGYHTDQGFDVKSLEDGYIALGYTSSQPGTTRGNFYLVKTDLDGNKLWENNYGTEYLDFGFAVLPEDSGYFWLLGAAGGFYNPARADFLNPDSDIMLVKTDRDGNEIFRDYYGGLLHDWGKDLIKADDGGVYVFGSTQSEGAGSFDMYLLKLDANGIKQWDRTYGESDFEYGKTIGMDPAGNLFLMGSKQMPGSEGGPDLYVVKTNQNGEVLWETTIGGQGSDYAHDLVSMPDSGCVIVGEIENIESNQTDIYVVRLDKDGRIMGIDVPPGHIVQDAVKFFPNPVSDLATIEWEGLPPPGGYRLQVISLSGRIIKSEEYQSLKSIQLNLNELPVGTYLYQIIYSNKSLTGKFMTR